MVLRTKSCRLNELTREYLKELAPKATVIIPVGSIEQHGPHLPVGMDSFAVEYVAVETAQRIGDQSVLVAPTAWYGYSPHHLSYSGVMSLRGETLLAFLCDLGNSLVAGGFRRIFYLTGHGGNTHLIGQAAREVATGHEDVIAGAGGYWDISKTALVREGEKLGTRWVPGHAGVIETAITMAIHEELVDQEALNGITKNMVEIDHILCANLQNRAFMERSGYIRTIDGCSDSPANATPEIGRHLLDTIVEEMTTFFNDMKNY